MRPSERFHSDRGLELVMALAAAVTVLVLVCALTACTSSASSNASESSKGAAAETVMDANDKTPSAAEIEAAKEAAKASQESAEASASAESADADGEAQGEEEPQDDEAEEGDEEEGEGDQSDEPDSAPEYEQPANADEASTELELYEDYRDSFVHGYKGAEYQKYIVLHDTESDADASSIVSYWDGNGAGVAAHFVVNKDGSVVQCVPLDSITHHAGFGDTGHNEYYDVEDESRDDMVGTTPIGDWAADYGMNSYSIGIEMVHVGGSGWYSEEQLEALDALIAYIDAYYGFESEIIDHKAWRSGNSDTSPEFADYLANYQDHRTHY